jgi:hypothetical protein
MLAQEGHADEWIDFGRFDLDGSVAAIPNSRWCIRPRRCAAHRWMRAATFRRASARRYMPKPLRGLLKTVALLQYGAFSLELESGRQKRV